MSRPPKVAPLQLTVMELRWLLDHTVQLLGGSGYFYKGVGTRINAASVRDKVQAHLNAYSAKRRSGSQQRSDER